MDIILLILFVIMLAVMIIQRNQINKNISLLKEKQSAKNNDLENKINYIYTFSEKTLQETSTLIAELKSSVGASEDEMRSSIANINCDNTRNQEHNKECIDEVVLKINALAGVLQSLADENNDLKKKLAFFTEIDEDSQKLNNIDDETEQNALIEKILQQIKQDYKQNADEQKIIETGNETHKKNITSQENQIDTSILSSQEPVLDDEQKAAYQIMSDTDQNILITGKAGTGKSFLLKLFVSGNSSKKIIMLAPTGIAAINIGGATIHSTFGFTNLVNASFDDLRKGIIILESIKRKVLASIDVIIIDEISMVRADIFEKMDLIMRAITKENKPFGGKQILLFGDLFQLPPIAQREEYKYLMDVFGGIYFFNSNAYKEGNFKFIELSINHRQKDDEAFFAVLNRIREGKANNTDLSLLNERTQFNENQLRRVIRLFPKKIDAEKVNKNELEKIEAKEYSYKAEIRKTKTNMTQTLIENTFPILATLRLRRGALVMLTANDSLKRWANGTLGIVSDLGDDYIKVKINNVEYEIAKYLFKEQEAVYREGNIVYEPVCEIEQYPILLAYAITIHKSQGMTYKQVACDISNCFAPGQAYVALSRCSSLNGLFLLKEVNANLLKVDTSVKNFYLSKKSSEHNTCS